ncbi:MAG: TolC family protein [Pyrinomonadaceae bacterium]
MDVQSATSISDALPIASPQTHSQTSHPEPNTSGVTVASLVEAALAVNPEITAMRREFDAARARVPQQKALPDPMVSFSNNTVGNPIPFAGLNNDFSEITVGASQDLPWFGVRRLRGQVASAESEAKFQEYAATVRRITAEVKTAYYDLYNTERALTIIRRDQDILDKMAQVAEARYSVGKAQQVDAINARVEITELLHRQGELEIKQATALAQLNTLLFRDPETPVGALAPVRLSAEPPPLEELERLAAENAPELAQQRRLIDARSRAVRLAEREAKYPEVGLNFTYHNRPLFLDYYTYGVTLRLPLYAATKQRYAIEEQSANLAAARSRLASNDVLIRNRLREARTRAIITARLIRLHDQGLLPQATLALESSLSTYQVGQVEFLTVLTAVRRALNIELRYYELVTDYQRALAEIERYTGVELTR